MFEILEKKKLDINNKNDIFSKNYEYVGKKALKIFFGLTREKGKNTYKIAKSLEKDFPEMNFMKVLEYKSIKNSPFHIKSKIYTENINKTFSGNFITYYEYLRRKNDVNFVYEAIEFWLEIEKKFLVKGYYHLDFGLGNFFIDENTKKVVFIDFDDIIKNPLFFRRKFFLIKSIRSFEGTVKHLIVRKNFSKEENIKILNKIEEIKKIYNVPSREKDLRRTKRILKK